MGSQEEHRAADCQMVHGRHPECGADGEAVTMLQVLTAAIRTNRNPHRFPLDIGIWCQCSQKYRWCFNTHNSLNSHHLDPKETACLDSLISDHVLLHGWQLEVTFLHFCFVLFCYLLIILTFLFSFSELLLLTLSLIALSALNSLGHLIPHNSHLPFITREQIWRWGVCIAHIHAHK